MAQISNGESGLSARNKLNEVIDKIEGNSAIGNDIEVTGTVTMDGGSTSADFTFGDNDKAIFGAGSDLQIYHNGGSFIDDVGTGNLILKTNGNKVAFQNDNSGSPYDMLKALTSGAVQLNYLSDLKLATTSTGVDITGTLTSDALTVETAQGNISIANSASSLNFARAGTSYIRATDTSGNFTFVTGANDYVSKRLTITSAGDISFYEDTGITPKMVWSAADESLAIGAAATSGLLNVETNSSGYAISLEEYAGAETWQLGVDVDGDLNFYNSGSATPSVTFDDSSNVGIGTSDPSTRLDVSTSTSTIATFRVPSGGGANNKRLEVATGGDRVIFKAYTDSDSSAAAIAFNNGATSEAMRITSDGSLLVGKTSADNTTAGTTIYGSAPGNMSLVRDGGSSLVMNRLNSDGDIAVFRKNGSTVGSIGAANGVPYFYGSSGFRLGGSIQPITSTGALSDNTTDIGQSNARFKDLYLSGTVNTDSVSTASADLTAIAKDISDTAVDVFVYDTSKDSDGGAWRKRTQGTSWYNETLNTATRGARREFPAVAVIVATVNPDKIVVYDGDDPDLPMWIVFDDYDYLMRRDVSCVTALNGIIATGTRDNTATPGGFRGLVVSNFVSDTTYYYQHTSASVASTGIGQRSTFDVSTDISYYLPATIFQPDINDVAMTVLPNAPIDAATGLPVPTIAVATDSGVSVVTDSGAVYDSAYTAGVAVIAFDGGNGLWYNRNTSYHALSYASLQDWTSGDGFGDVVASTNIDSSSFNLLTRGTSHGFGVYGSTLFSGAISATGTHLKKLHLHDINYEDQSEGLDAAISTEFNTGWMHGDIKLVTLSDTDDTDVTGSELSSDTWAAAGGYDNTVTSISASAFSSVYNTTQNRVYVVVNTVVGKTYTFTATKTSGGNAIVYIREGSAGTGTIIADAAAANYHSITFTATTVTTSILFRNDGSDYAYEDISVRIAEEDRSVNGNGLQVFGTVTKNPVATGADLVGYSGFSTSNYLEQPYNSDLDFGTGDFCYMGWFKTSSNGITMFERCASPRSGNGMTVYMDGTGKAIWYKIVSGTPTIVVTPTAAYNNNTWVHFAVIRQNGIVSLHFNGQKDGSASDSTDMNNTSAVFRLGANATATSGWTGSLALWRISATAPSPEQIAKIYEDEKVLFQENAQATLHGSSDAVTALGYDDTTELLHVGTSAGRSVFQGLRRVDNTTDAVGAAISASNGLVAED